MKNYNSNQITSLFKGPDSWFNALLGCVWGYHLLVVINAAFLRLPGLNVVGDYARDIVIFVIFLFAFKAFSKRVHPKDIIFCFIFLIFYLFQFVIHPENQQDLSDNMFLVFGVALPMYFIGYVLNIDKLYNYLLVISIVCILFNGFLSFIYSPNTGRESSQFSYSMGTAYRMLPHVLFVFGHFYKTRKIYALAIFILGLLLEFSYGTRGPIVCVACFVVFLVVSSTSKKNWWVLLLVIAAAGFAMVYFDWIVIFLDRFLSSMGSSTRLTNKVYTDTLDDDSGRGAIINKLKGLLDTGDQLSYGIFGSYKYVDGYAHRFYWDFWFSFGYIGGTILMLVFALLFNKGRKKCITSEEKVFWLLLFCNSIIGLLFSSSWIISGPFYLFLGYCVSRIRNHKSELIEMKYEKTNNS